MEVQILPGTQGEVLAEIRRIIEDAKQDLQLGRPKCSNVLQIHMGYFRGLDDAQEAVQDARNKHFTHNDLDKKDEI